MKASILAAALGAAGLGFGCKPSESGDVTDPARAAAEPVSAALPPRECETLVARLCSEFGEASAVCGLSRRETQRFSAEHCAAMLGRYDQVAAEARRLEAGRRQLASSSPGPAQAMVPALGPARAKVTLVAFSDFDCADCARAAPMATTVKNLYGDSVRFVFRQFPLTTHPYARLAAEASLAAQAQGRFWEYHDVLFANQHDLGRAALERYAAYVGLDLAEFRRALDEHLFAADVDADRALGRDVLVSELPALFVNGERVEVPYGVAELSALIERGFAAD